MTNSLTVVSKSMAAKEPVLHCVLMVSCGRDVATRAHVMLCVDGATWLQEPMLCCVLMVPRGYNSQCYVVC